MATLESPYVLASFLTSLEANDAALQADLEMKLVEVMQTNSEVDVVFHRTRIHGLR